MKPKFAITCIILLIVANLSVVYFRSCNEGFKVKKKEEEEEEEDDPPKRGEKKKKIKKDPCEELLDSFEYIESYISNINTQKDDRIKELMRMRISLAYNQTVKNAIDKKCMDTTITEKENKKMKIIDNEFEKSKGSGSSLGSSFGSSFGF